jgi:hypothetical protein
MKMDKTGMVVQARLLALRLERLSADSIWAHKVCGLRGSLLRAIDDHDSGNPDIIYSSLDDLMCKDYSVLEKAVRASLRTRTIIR